VTAETDRESGYLGDCPARDGSHTCHSDRKADVEQSGVPGDAREGTAAYCFSR
jgi:hypothetical protein